MFAEFEAGLREAWQRALNKASVPTTGQLLLGVAARRSITGPLFGNADRVRTYRNAIVHEGNESVEPVSVPEAVRYLRRFFSHLPPDW
ncbi:MAG: hypothetical protein U0746_18785 [Gemmataceae bacterium]